jgi:hypothetical protein
LTLDFAVRNCETKSNLSQPNLDLSQWIILTRRHYINGAPLDKARRRITMRKNLFFTIATVAALGSTLLLPLAAEAKSRTAVQHRAAATQSTITSFSSSSAPTSSAASQLNVGVNHPAKK